MNKKKLQLIIFGLFIFMQLLPGFAETAAGQRPPTSDRSQQSSLVGTWKSSDSTMEIRSDGTMTLNGRQYTYKSNASELIVTNNNKTVNFPYDLNGDYLTITLSSQRIMYRRGSGGGSAGGSNGDEIFSSGNSRRNNASPDIVGTWKSEDQTTLDIRADGTMSINGTSYPYKSNGSALSVSNGKGGAAKFPYEFDGDDLIVTIQGKPVPFKRIGGGSLNNESNNRGEQRSGGQSRQKSDSTSGLVGRWKSDKGILEFSEDGMMTINGEQVPYKVNGSSITVSSPQGSLNFPFRVSGDQLVMGASGRQVVYTRIGGSNNNSDENNENDSSFENTPSPRGGSNSGSIVGRWQSDEATLDIRPNGTITINGEQYSYQVSGSTIRVSSNEGSLDFPFQLSGDKMVVSVQGRRVIYTRITGNGRGNAGMTGGNNRGVLQELVGKWCYYGNARPNSGNIRTSESCITLNADGTFTYFENNHTGGPPGAYTSETRDSGRWSATAHSITSQSNSTGTNTFRLEKRNHPKNGDPMIVLDGKEFVTAYKRSPW